ncbi:MAG: hypothetical protein JXR39_12510 [Marinilabiliaceae bacterium]|nr:hypothetical protein [Marinilabiliaceae bacterium]
MRKILLLALWASTAHLMAKETTVSTADELKTAISSANAGDIIWVAAGTYAFTTAPGIAISRSGTSTNPITLKAVEGTRPVIDFSGQARDNSSAQGMKLTTSYWHIKGLDFYKAGDNGLQIAGGHYNTIEFCNFYECNDSGLQIDNGATNNLILNCDSYFNADGSNENADGFACKLSVGNDNKFKGCRSWRNLDDGWDGYLRNTDNISTYYEDCWTFQNGYDKDGVAGSGDGNGFKTGGSDVLSDGVTKVLKHNASYIRCIAVGNRVKGFDHNSNRGDITLYNCAAYANATNIGFGSTNPVNILTIKNSVVVGATGSINATTLNVSHNSWNGGVTANEWDYVDFTTSWYTQLSAPRKSDGSLPDLNLWKLVANSDLIDKGTNVGLAFAGSAPDMGPFEYGLYSSIPLVEAETEAGNLINTQYFNLTGKEVDEQFKGILIVRRAYDSGRVTIHKVVNR